MRIIKNPHRAGNKLAPSAPYPSTDATRVADLLSLCPAAKETPLVDALDLAQVAHAVGQRIGLGAVLLLLLVVVACAFEEQLRRVEADPLLEFADLSVAERETIEAGVLNPMADFLSTGSPQTFDRIHNHATWATTAVGMTGYVLDQPERVEMALYGLDRSGEAGFLKQLVGLFLQPSSDQIIVAVV